MLSLIKTKRDGGEHAREELAWLVSNVKDVPDYQLSAWLMAVVCRGMSLAETTDLTDLMAHSGQIMDLSDVPGPCADKHSTGGVGDKVTLVLAPLVASAGVTVAKLSGRGLGHTGGTVDKVEAIPGFNPEIPIEQFKQQLREIRVALASQTGELAPADGIFYAMRDVSGTVESIPLIAASVLSKKIASGADVILLDVKTGSGAFMKDDASAKDLADTMMEVGRRLGKQVVCVVSEMGQPLGHAVGHSNEVAEAIQTLQGNGPADLTELCVRLGGLILLGAGTVSSAEAGEAKLREAIADGSAIYKFREFVAAQGGDSRVVDHPEIMPQPRLRVPVEALADGFVQRLDALPVGIACKELGGGRLYKGAPLDLAVGVDLRKKIGDRVQKGEALAYLLVNDEAKLAVAVDAVQSAYGIGPVPATSPDLIRAVYAAQAVPAEV